MNLSRLSSLSRRTGARRMLVAALATTAIGAAACDDPFAPTATTSVRIDSFTVYAVSQTPVNVPAAFNILFFTPLRLEPTYGFDIVFDIDANGKAVIIPVKLVGGVIAANRQVGLQKITGPYDQVTRAPTTGYFYDSTVVLSPDEGVIIELATDACQYQTSQLVYAKIQIQAINAVTRQIAFRISYDPNCGFRSFLPGVPTN